MGTSAVGLNSSIPLDTKTIPAADPAEQLGRVMALKNAAVTGQLNQGKLQEQQIALQQARENQDAQNAWNLALKNNGKVDADGNYALDADGALRDLTASGHGTQAIALRKSTADAAKAAADAKVAQFNAIGKGGELLANLWDGVKMPDLTVTDPTLRAQQIKNFQDTGSTAIALGLHNQLIDPGHAAAFTQILQNPTPEGIAQLQTFVQAGIKNGERAKQASDQLTAVADRLFKSAETNKTNAALPGEQAKSEKDLQSNASSILSPAAAESLPEYTRSYDALAKDPKYKGVIDQYPKPEEFTDNDSLTAAVPKIRALGQTAEQQQTSAQTGAAQTIAQQRADTADARAAEQAKRTDALIARTGQLTPAQVQQQADKDRAERDKDAALHTKYQNEEADLWTRRAQLGSAIAKAGNSDSVVDPKTQKPLDIADARAQADDAQQKALNLQAQAKQIRQKNGWGEFASGQPTTPATTPKPGTVAAKVFPLTKIHDYAVANKITDGAAKQYLTGNGYKLQ